MAQQSQHIPDIIDDFKNKDKIYEILSKKQKVKCIFIIHILKISYNHIGITYTICIFLQERKSNFFQPPPIKL